MNDLMKEIFATGLQLTQENILHVHMDYAAHVQAFIIRTFMPDTDYRQDKPPRPMREWYIYTNPDSELSERSEERMRECLSRLQEVLIMPLQKDDGSFFWP